MGGVGAPQRDLYLYVDEIPAKLHTKIILPQQKNVKNNIKRPTKK
jgi:hypothetical protein